MTAASRLNRPQWPTAPHLAVVGSEPPEVTIQITVRGNEALAAIVPLIAAVRSIGQAEVAVEIPQSPATRPRWPEPDDTSAPAATGAPLRILTQEYAATLDGECVPLPRREYDLLVFLAKHPRRVFTRGQLLQTVWGYEFSGGGRTVDVHIRRLRQKLGDRGPSIATVRGVGYRLDDPELVEVIEPQQS